MSHITAIAAPSPNLKADWPAAPSSQMERRRAKRCRSGSEFLTIEEETQTLFVDGGVRMIRAKSVVTRERS